MDDHGILSVEPDIRWRDLFDLNIPNDNFRKRAVTFLDLFEKAAFCYNTLDPQTQTIEARYLSGQDILQEVAARRQKVRQLMAAVERGDTGPAKEIRDLFAEQHIIKTGKYPIIQHDLLYDGTDQTECFTRHATIPGIGTFPWFITIGADYLKGTKYKGADGKFHSISVDQALVHEITHLAYATLEEETPRTVEAIVIAAMGAVHRASSGEVEFSRGSNGGFQSLAHKAKPQGRLSDVFGSPASGNTDASADDTKTASLNTPDGPTFKLV